MTTTLQNLLPTVDLIRGQATTFGVRLYRVFVRTRTWASGEVGNGSFTDSDVELLPRPRVQAQAPGGEFAPLEEMITAGGARFEGKLRIDRVSALYALATLMPAQAPGVKTYISIQPDAAGGSDLISSAQLWAYDQAPFRKTTEWVFTVVKVEG